MTPDEFRAAGHELIDWIADFRETLQARTVSPAVSAGQMAALLPDTAPPTALGWEAAMGLVERASEGIVHTQHPMHFAWFPSNASLSSALADLASTGLGALGLSWESAPALTEFEQVVCGWSRDAVGLDGDWHGVISDTASTSCVVSLVAARERARRRGVAVDDMTVAYSEHAHSSVRKAARIAGFDDRRHRVVPVDDDFALRVDALAAMWEGDERAGLVPGVVVATIGATNTASVDPLDNICAAADRLAFRPWVHVDAALAGGAMLLPEMRDLWRGVERADSVAWNPHKWWGAALDCSLHYVRDPEALTEVFGTSPSYLKGSDDGDVVQYRDWGIPLGRRFRALKLLFLVYLDGLDVVARRIRRDLDNARWLADTALASDGWEVVAPVHLQTVCLVHRPADLDPTDVAALNAHTRRWLAVVTAERSTTLTAALIDDRWVVRVSIGAEPTEREHVEALWALMCAAVA